MVKMDNWRRVGSESAGVCELSGVLVAEDVKAHVSIQGMCIGQGSFTCCINMVPGVMVGSPGLVTLREVPPVMCSTWPPSSCVALHRVVQCG